MDEHAVIGVDFTPAWDQLRQRLGVLSVLGLARVTLVHVLGGHYPTAPSERHRQHYEHRLDEVASELAGSGLGVERQVRVGEPARELVAAAAELGATCVVVGSEGYTPLRDALLGNTVSEVLRYGAPSVLLVPSGDEQGEAGGGVVLGTDGSVAARNAEEVARRLATRLPLVVATVVRDDAEEVDDAGSFRGVEPTGGIEVVVRTGRPSEQLALLADQRRADVVVVGRRGRNAARDLLLGSTAEHLLDSANRPVLIVP